MYTHLVLYTAGRRTYVIRGGYNVRYVRRYVSVQYEVGIRFPFYVLCLSVANFSLPSLNSVVLYSCYTTVPILCIWFRETFMHTVYNNLLGSWESGMVGGGCLLWQLFREGAEHMDDGYVVIFAKSPSTFNLLANHSRKLE
ncbi:Mannan endo-1,4-beta-mannosidase 7 [Hordeum vulgare]|nr:Mannan endo-1,4-beta-mannosidase 7 [Hordeum vulgare]